MAEAKLSYDELEELLLEAALRERAGGRELEWQQKMRVWWNMRGRRLLTKGGQTRRNFIESSIAASSKRSAQAALLGCVEDFEREAALQRSLMAQLQALA